MDKRIIKTKKGLKLALKSLLSEKNFEKVTVKEICERSDSSRITFYSHYKDKYELIDEIFQDLMEEANRDFEKLQEENNPNNCPIQDYTNLLECILNTYFNNNIIFKSREWNELTYVEHLFARYVLEYIEVHIAKMYERLVPRYSIKQTTYFIYYGIWGFLRGHQAENATADQFKKDALQLLGSMLHSDMLAIRD